jgi:hypothetical protein
MDEIFDKMNYDTWTENGGMTFHKWNQFLWMIVTVLIIWRLAKKTNGSEGDECDPVK